MGASLYRPDEIMWQVNREAILLLAGPRALLMQLAHPLVAAGVGAHSDFHRDPLGRLQRTLDSMLGMIFGTPEEAEARAARVNAIHAGVRGELAQGTTHLASGTPYSALEPTLLFWVLGTLVDSAVVAYECFVRPLTPAERERHYQESMRLAPLLRVPASAVPPDRAAFRKAMEAMLAGPVLEITPEARELADAVLHPPVRGIPRSLGDLGSVVTLGLLPEVLRERYGFVWDRKRQLAWRAGRAAVRGALPLLPDVMRAMPQARRAERRLQAAAKPSGSRSGAQPSSGV